MECLTGKAKAKVLYIGINTPEFYGYSVTFQIKTDHVVQNILGWFLSF
jgi:hypothetical protein